MSKVYYDEHAKNADDVPLTRAQQQERLDFDYAHGKLTREQWSERTDELSDTTKWNAEGRVKKGAK